MPDIDSGESSANQDIKRLEMAATLLTGISAGVPASSLSSATWPKALLRQSSKSQEETRSPQEDRKHLIQSQSHVSSNEHQHIKLPPAAFTVIMPVQSHVAQNTCGTATPSTPSITLMTPCVSGNRDQTYFLNLSSNDSDRSFDSSPETKGSLMISSAPVIELTRTSGPALVWLQQTSSSHHLTQFQLHQQ
jgi:hypothetical protein